MAEILPEHNTSERSALVTTPKQEEIPWGRCHSELQRLAAKQGLFFKEKRLAPDFFGRATLCYEIEKEEDLHTIRVKITAGSRSFYLDECLWTCPGPPLLFIHGIGLKASKEHIPTTWLWKLFKSPLTLKPDQFYRFSNECIDPSDPDLPSISGSFSSPPKEDPLPVFILRDRVGATGQLLLLQDGKQHLVDHRLSKELIKTARHWEKDLLETDFVRQQSANATYYCPIDRIGKSLSFLLECGWRIKDYLGREVLAGSATPLSADQQGETVLLQSKVSFSDYTADAKEVVGAFNRQETFVNLSNNSVGLLSGIKSVETLAEAAREGEICSDGIRLPAHRISSLGNDLEVISGVEELSSLLKTAAKDFTGIAHTPIPSKFKGKLRPYQQHGVNWLTFLDKNNFGGILADDMGLGKTVQILAYLSSLKNCSSLIVVPRSLIFNWKKEISTFFPTATVLIHHGTERENAPEALKKADIVLTSYGILRRDLPIFQQIKWETIILDEAQAIKNPDSLAAKAAVALSGKLRVAVSGTPIENNLMELWSLFQFSLPGLLDKRETFARDLVSGESDPRYLKRLQQKIRPFILRRTKEIAAPDLPEKLEQIVWIELPEKQRNRYEAFLSGARKGVLAKTKQEGAKKHRMEILETLLRLRQMCCHPLLVENEDPLNESAKLDALLLDLENVHSEGHKALVYSQFTSMLSLIKKALNSKGWKYSYLDGATHDREAAVRKFQEDPEIPFFLISLKAGGVGLNLTQADYVFLYDPWWNRAAEAQAIDRAHRIGRTDRVIARRYVAANTVEEKILRLSEKKSDLADTLIDNGKLGEAFDAEDLAKLLE